VSRICFGTWSFGGEWGDVEVADGAATAAHQGFVIEQAKRRESDFSAVIQTMRELAEVPAPVGAKVG
jgi:hypothetical protein